MAERLTGAVLSQLGPLCPVCNGYTAIIRKSIEDGEDIMLNYFTFCTHCQKKISEGKTKVIVDKYGRTKVDI